MEVLGLTAYSYHAYSGGSIISRSNFYHTRIGAGGDGWRLVVEALSRRPTSTREYEEEYKMIMYFLSYSEIASKIQEGRVARCAGQSKPTCQVFSIHF